MMGRVSKGNEAKDNRLSNLDLVLLAAFSAGAALRVVDTEDIAVGAHKIDGSRFAWRKYPSQIDLERVRVRLSEARVEGYLAGLHSEGWRLTSAGVNYVQTKLLQVAQSKGERVVTQIVSVRKVDRAWISAERKRLTGTSAYKKVNAGTPELLTKMEIREFFRVDEYMSKDVVREKLDRLAAAFDGGSKIGATVRSLMQIVPEVLS